MSVTSFSLATLLLTSYGAGAYARMGHYVEQGDESVFEPLTPQELQPDQYNLTDIKYKLEHNIIDEELLPLFAEPEKDESENYDKDIDYIRVFKSTLKFHDLVSMEAVRSLLALNVDVNLVYHNGETLLSYAASYGNIAAMQLLLAKGADVNKVGDGSDFKYRTHCPLAASAKAKLNDAATVETVKLLLAAGADVDLTPNKFTGTALAQAAGQGKLQTMQLLLKYGADLNKGIYNSPLSKAVKYNQIAAVEVLLEEKCQSINRSIERSRVCQQH
ncbi:MAG: ankyrin repeat domain-containing protein [Pseudomonadota bacterium]